MATDAAAGLAIGTLVRVKPLPDERRALMYAGKLGRITRLRDGEAWVDSDQASVSQAVSFRAWFLLDELEACDYVLLRANRLIATLNQLEAYIEPHPDDPADRVLRLAGDVLLHRSELDGDWYVLDSGRPRAPRPAREGERDAGVR